MEFESVGIENTNVTNTSFATSGNPLLGGPKFEQLFSTLSSAKSITRHLDFYNWLQNEVFDYLPHEVLLVAWGDFEKGGLSYDAASALPGVNTQFISSLSFLEKFVSNLHRRARSNGLGWYLLQDFDDVETDDEIWPDSRFLRIAGAKMKSLLVYALRDERDSLDSVYIFYSIKTHIDIDPLTLDLLMPHVDNALRRLKCLSRETRTGEDKQSGPPFNLLSKREQEVMDWVCEGKSNLEIGVALGISHNTVKNHLKRIFNKLGVTVRSHAVQVYLNSNTVSK